MKKGKNQIDKFITAALHKQEAGKVTGAILAPNLRQDLELNLMSFLLCLLFDANDFDIA